MSTNPNRNTNSDRFQYSMRALLIVVTAACVVLGVLEIVLPQSTPIELRLLLYVMIALMMGYGVWAYYRMQRQPWKTPVNCVTVNVDAKWKHRVKSPFIYGPIAALTGVSLTFAPAFLLWCGQLQKWGVFEWVFVPLSFATICIVPGFYMRLAAEVIAELRKIETPAIVT